jgi:hypothetical protein
MTDMPSEAELQTREERVRANAAASPASPEGPAKNTDRELFREDTGITAGSHYENSVHVTEAGHIGMNVGGRVVVLPIADWHALAWPAPRSPEGPDEALRERGRLRNTVEHRIREVYRDVTAGEVMERVWRWFETDAAALRTQRDEARERADRLAQGIGNLCATADEYVAEMRTLNLHPEAAAVLSAFVTLVNRSRAALSDPEATP